MRESERLKRISLGVVFSTAIGFAACEQAGSLATGPREIELAGKPPAIDIAGTWSFSEEAKGLIPEFAEFFGIQPEGRATHFICHDEGTLTIVQDGSSFTGTTEQTGICVTNGGQS